MPIRTASSRRTRPVPAGSRAGDTQLSRRLSHRVEAHLGKQHGWPWVALPYLVLSYGAIVLQFIVRRIGVDLTPEAAVIRGRRRQTVLWRHVQSVVSRVSSNGSSAVLLVFEDGGSVTLPFPKTLWRKGDAPYQRDLERIDQWWLAHRGEAWCPVSKAV